MKIVTLTLNPAFDLHCFSKNFKPFYENLADITDFEAGGKGINIARALTVNGIKQTSVVLLGDENGASFENALKKDGIDYIGITVEGRIRENITIHTDNADETRISFRGFSADKKILKLIEDKLSDLTCGDIVTLTGRNPDGMDIADVKEFVKNLQNRGIRIVIDSRSFALNDILEVKPWLIKPNQEEISEYLGRTVNSFEDIKSAAEELHKKGIENVMISLGGKGAYLLCDDGEFMADAPKIDAVSTIGAGDSSIAGFIAAKKSGKTASECLKTAVAYGTAACLSTGTRPPLEKDIKKFLK